MTLPTRREALDAATARLRAGGVGLARLEARRLLEAAAGLAQGAMVTGPDARLDTGAADRLAAMLARRLAGEPLSRILGRREFWSLEFELSANTLDPRPDSETIVEAALERLPAGRAARVLDLGTGTGCLLLAVLSERPLAFGTGVDLSEGACRTARANARRLGFASRAAFAVADWAAPLAGPFDLVLSNPPYIETAAVAGLDRDVRDHDPHRALDGGADGLDAYRAIAPAAARLLAPGGAVVLEVGAGQADAVGRLLAAAGLDLAAVRRDLAGIARAVVAVKKMVCSPAVSV